MNFWTNWVEAVRFTYEVQGVISLRLLLLASGRSGSADEVVRMIFEKVDAFATDLRGRRRQPNSPIAKSAAVIALPVFSLLFVFGGIY
jgi:hypothetical protein